MLQTQMNYSIHTPHKVSLEGLSTESNNAATKAIDRVSTLEIMRLLNAEDKKVPLAVEKTLPQIAAAVDIITDKLQNGGRLFYIGAGTSGRMGVLDASECPPTYGVAPELVQGIIAGGNDAMFQSQEGAEDSPVLAMNDLKTRNLSPQDIVVGLAASGRTPYVIGGLEFAHRIGAATIAIACNENSRIAELADIAVIPIVGPEAIAGSTRLKAGTAQKLVLNMLSTGTMIKLGKVYQNLMVDVQANNLKLKERACRIVMEATGTSRDESLSYLAQTGDQVKTAIFMLLSGQSLPESLRLLESHQGHIVKALQALKTEE